MKTSAMHTGQRTVMVSWGPDMYHRHHEESRKRHFQSIYDSHLKLQYRIKNAHNIQFCTQEYGWTVDLVTDHWSVAFIRSFHQMNSLIDGH